MRPSPDMIEYYARRAAEYEDIYRKPERQADLARLRADIPPMFADRDVLEVACGTGYWTELVAACARSVLATDVGEEVLAIARSKPNMPANVEFVTVDAMTLRDVSGAFDAAMVGFWWSHVRHEARAGFLDALCDRLSPGGLVVMVDNTFVPDSSTAACRSDELGNSFQLRTLSDGSRFEVVKNYDTEETIRRAVHGRGEIIRFEELHYYWWCGWTVGPGRIG